MTTDERIARLEIHNRRLTWALAGLLIIAASALFLGRADGDRDRVVTARGFVVVNGAGTELVRIGESDTGPGAILIRNSAGARVAQLDATEDLGGSLWLYDGTTMPRTIITTDAKLGAHAMFVDAEEGNVAAQLGDVGRGEGYEHLPAGETRGVPLHRSEARQREPEPLRPGEAADGRSIRDARG